MQLKYMTKDEFVSLVVIAGRRTWQFRTCMTQILSRKIIDIVIDIVINLLNFLINSSVSFVLRLNR